IVLPLIDTVSPQPTPQKLHTVLTCAAACVMSRPLLRPMKTGAYCFDSTRLRGRILAGFATLRKRSRLSLGEPNRLQTGITSSRNPTCLWLLGASVVRLPSAAGRVNIRVKSVVKSHAEEGGK